MEPAEPSARPLLSANNERTDDGPESSANESTVTLVPAPATSNNDPRTSKKSNRAQYTSRLRQRSRNALHLLGSGWKTCAGAWKRIWSRSWTAETCSYVVSILALAALIATLQTHQNKPLPQWPQLVTINSIISLFSLCMRASTGVVLAEGIIMPN